MRRAEWSARLHIVISHVSPWVIALNLVDAETTHMVSVEAIKKPAAPIKHIQDHLGYWLRFVSNHVLRAFSEKLAAREVTVAEWVVLRELFGQEGVIASELATGLGMTRGGISKIIDRLESRGLLHRVNGQEDRRFQGLALTSEGRALVPRLPIPRQPRS